ncbi:hypothetical protein [Phenylobacterium sp.]|uniref:hypothetical protein n=1 Tax=Phenylobacterium sp. TaxID=1871053 RepID=UPI002737CE8B|nr:hypothetical protein [Phenylobacterium sp.]MDP3869135.1 hypothetical protein [Phenylobacterium sp.]
MARLRDKAGRFLGTQEPDPGPLWIEAPSDPSSWGEPNSCSVVDFRRPMPDPDGKGGKGFEAVFHGTYAECDAWLARTA